MEERKTGNITTRVQFLMDIYLGLLSPEKKNISILKKHTKSFTTYFKLFNIYTGWKIYFRRKNNLILVILHLLVTHDTLNLEAKN